jgi:hypothetical protein
MIFLYVFGCHRLLLGSASGGGDIAGTGKIKERGARKDKAVGGQGKARNQTRSRGVWSTEFVSPSNDPLYYTKYIYYDNIQCRSNRVKYMSYYQLEGQCGLLYAASPVVNSGINDTYYNAQRVVHQTDVLDHVYIRSYRANDSMCLGPTTTKSPLPGLQRHGSMYGPISVGTRCHPSNDTGGLPKSVVAAKTSIIPTSDFETIRGVGIL